MMVRNSGCRWGKFFWKGLNILILENDILRIEILVDKGTDIVEFLYKPLDIDFMWRSPMPFYESPGMIPTSPGKIGNFLDYYPGGWQEVLPNGGLPCEYKGANLGLHGEISLLPWNYELLEDSPEKISVKFKVKTFRTPFSVEKIMSLKKGEPELLIEETVTNMAGEEMDFIWGHHPAFGKPFISSDCVIKIKKAKVNICQGDGKSFTNLKHQEGEWPLVDGVEGKKVDISKCPSENDRVSEVMFLSDLSEGCYEIINEKLQVGFKLEFPLSVFKYLWFWRVAKGSFNYPWYGRTYNIALEPFSSLPNLTKAVKTGDQLKLGPGKSMKAKLAAYITTI